MLKTVCILLLLSSGITCFSQVSDSLGTFAPHSYAKKNSFQFIINDSLSSEPPISVNADLLKLIETYRHPSIVVFYPLTANVTIKIFPQSAIYLYETE